MKNKFPLLILIACFYSSLLYAQHDTAIAKDIIYAEAGTKKLLLDLYMPVATKQPYLVVWIHGGAWRSGSKEDPPLGLLKNGYALASINYRLSEEAIFPAPIHDIKAAIRFLRGNAKKYGYRADKIIIWGSSSGGHYAALVGTTNGDPYYEGNLGAYTKESSSVQAILDFYGPTNFLTILDQSTPHGISVRVPALKLLLGKPVEEVPDLARKASPVFQVDVTDPPIFIAHGDQDPQVPVNQSLELMAAYKQKSLTVEIEFLPGAAHGGKAFDDKDFIGRVKKFLEKVLEKKN
ncbi:MAG: alpha/beta hydrolase [Chitinophagaceae bacterium]